MPQETFKLKTSTAAANGSVKKEGVTITVAFAGKDKSETISTSWSFSGPEEAMKTLFAAWPVNFDDIKGMVKVPIDVEATIATVVATTAGAVNQIANDAATAAEACTDATPPSLDKVGADIKKLTA